MEERTSPPVSISEEELIGCARLIEARFADATQEAGRLALARQFLTAALAAESALRAHNRCAVVNHFGTHGTSNLVDVSATLFQTLHDYATVIRGAASRGGVPALQAGTGPHLVREVA